jgi:hypothetical protein
MQKTQVVGLVLWRGGLVAVVGWAAWASLKAVLSITDTQLETAVAVLLTGVVFIFLSILGERIEDVRQERGLRE